MDDNVYVPSSSFVANTLNPDPAERTLVTFRSLVTYNLPSASSGEELTVPIAVRSGPQMSFPVLASRHVTIPLSFTM